ncbi:unnamed protein product [Cyprideis torosa]|uniref:ER membrane protein complex subunit 6 n=1 Tax=Cyprideis torosa TaxID=163714 RepID=A0A7R8W8N7_9CRUS|nr:unnamed protein product [Cyprideis torosa]CAG0883402.1 unnamed protein product [Cyprideis torosa]
MSSADQSPLVASPRPRPSPPPSPTHHGRREAPSPPPMTAHNKTVDLLIAEVQNKAVSVGRLITLTYKEFLRQVDHLNSISQSYLPLGSGQQLIFVVRNDIGGESIFWKATVKVYCCTYDEGCKTLISTRVLSFKQFQKVYDNLVAQVNSTTRGIIPTPPSSPSAASAGEGAGATCAGTEEDPEDLKWSKVTDTSLDEDCCICLERKPEVSLPCAHCFCAPCIEQWNIIQGSCPVCRERVTNPADMWVISEIPETCEITEDVNILRQFCRMAAKTTKKSTGVHTEVVAFSEAANRGNRGIIEYCRTCMVTLAGCTAGILGLTGLQGFLFFFLSNVLLWFFVLYKAGRDWNKYFLSRRALLTGNPVGGLFTYVLFWVFFFGMVHVY